MSGTTIRATAWYGNVGDAMHERLLGVLGFTVVVVTAVGHLALLSGFLAFFASGGSFEQFEGLE